MAWNTFGNPYMPGVAGQFNPSQYMQMMNQQPAQIGQFNAQIAPQQPMNGLTRVTGMDGAKAYQMPANSVVALFDDANDIFYVKSTDGAGFPTIRVFDFFEHKEQPAPVQQAINPETYATKQELQTLQYQLEEVKGMISNGKQSVPEQPATEPKSSSRSSK